MVVTFKNMAIQYHSLAFLMAMEVRKIDHSNKCFSNGVISGTLLINIDKAIALKMTDLPPEAHMDFKGDNKPGISPDHLRGGK